MYDFFSRRKGCRRQNRKGDVKGSHRGQGELWIQLDGRVEGRSQQVEEIFVMGGLVEGGCDELVFGEERRGWICLRR